MLVAACAGGLDDPDRFRDSAAGTCPDGFDVPVQILEAKCGTAGCHAAESPQAGLDLASANARGRLSAVQASSSCVGELLLDPAAPTESVLYQKVAGTQCGPRMPSVGEVLSADEIECLRLWIAGTSTTS